jgi:adenine-specific DNA-methyltransferase
MRTELSWHGKSKAIQESQKPSNGTLIPVKSESKNWDSTQNVYIEGDNLEVLKLFQESYSNKIKMIYIDPPYNTGKDIIYQNNYSHTNWLNMMYPRLKLARNLLTYDGCMVVTIDHYELNNVINICDEIYGEDNRLGIVTIVIKPEGRQHSKFFSASTEYMIVYAKNKDFIKFNKVVLSEEKKKEFSEKDELGNFKWKNFIRGDTLKSQKPKGFYPIYVSNDLSDITLGKKDGYTEVLPINNDKERAWIVLPDGFKKKMELGEIKANYNRKKDKIEILYKIREQQVLTTHWVEKKYNATAYGTRILKDLFKNKIFDFPKSIYAVEDIIKIIADKESIVLDFFSGSATTAHSVMNLNSQNNMNIKFIMVQLPYPTDKKSEAFKDGYKNIAEIGKERIRRAGDKILKESDNKDLDVGFKVFKLDYK